MLKEGKCAFPLPAPIPLVAGRRQKCKNNNTADRPCKILARIIKIMHLMAAPPKTTSSEVSHSADIYILLIYIYISTTSDVIVKAQPRLRRCFPLPSCCSRLPPNSGGTASIYIHVDTSRLSLQSFRIEKVCRTAIKISHGSAAILRSKIYCR